jgi:hypothetical protein
VALKLSCAPKLQHHPIGPTPAKAPENQRKMEFY